MFDAIIVGAGPAGLSAALVLGRCRRRVLVIDAGKPRNAKSHGLHAFLTRDGIAPAEFHAIAREQLRQYDTVEIRAGTVTAASCKSGGFDVVLEGGGCLRSRKLLLATGVVDQLPPIEGIDELYGRSVFHCPYCDGWELRDQPLAIYGNGDGGHALSLKLTTWSRDLVLCTHGPAELTAAQRADLDRLGIIVREEPIARLEGSDGILARIVFERGAPIARRGLFFSTGWDQHSSLPALLGCHFDDKGAVATGDREHTNVPGLHVAGDASRNVQLVIIAAAEGAEAAFAINTALQDEDLSGNPQ